MMVEKDIIEECELLSDEDFLNRHPRIMNFAVFMNETAKIHYKMNREYNPFDRVGVNNIRDYLSLIQQGNPEAVRLYQKVCDLLGFD